jgi:hypothetical protein
MSKGSRTRPIQDPEAFSKNWEAIFGCPRKEKRERIQRGPRCPKCDCRDVDRIHHEATFAIPECTFWMCSECDEQWGHE